MTREAEQRLCRSLVHWNSLTSPEVFHLGSLWIWERAQLSPQSLPRSFGEGAVTIGKGKRQRDPAAGQSHGTASHPAPSLDKPPAAFGEGLSLIPWLPAGLPATPGNAGRRHREGFVCARPCNFWVQTWHLPPDAQLKRGFCAQNSLGHGSVPVPWGSGAAGAVTLPGCSGADSRAVPGELMDTGAFLELCGHPSHFPGKPHSSLCSEDLG